MYELNVYSKQGDRFKYQVCRSDSLSDIYRHLESTQGNARYALGLEDDEYYDISLTKEGRNI